jgi:hypothetical protein
VATSTLAFHGLWSGAHQWCSPDREADEPFAGYSVTLANYGRFYRRTIRACERR